MNGPRSGDNREWRAGALRECYDRGTTGDQSMKPDECILFSGGAPGFLNLPFSVLTIYLRASHATAQAKRLPSGNPCRVSFVPVGATPLPRANGGRFVEISPALPAILS